MRDNGFRGIPCDLRDCDIATFADLFCGIGGFHYGAENLGLKCVFASDSDEDCQNQYEHNFGLRPFGDITRLDAEQVPDHDILFAGFPCQPFSIIGDQKGFDDQRGRLIHDIIRVLRAKKPKAFVLENVRQLSTIQRGRTLEQIIKELSLSGYTCDCSILNALDFGLPQKRERTIIVGFIDDSLDMFEWPKPKDAYKPLSDILEPDPDSRFFVSERIRSKRQERHTTKTIPAIWHENKAGNISSHPFSCALRANASYNYLLVNGERRLTPREQLRLQGFPEHFEVIGTDSKIRKQTGNAVPVPMVRAVIREVLSAKSKNARRHEETRALSA